MTCQSWIRPEPNINSLLLVPEMYFRFWRPYCYFRLSVVVAIVWDTFFDVAVVGKLDFVTLLLELQQYLFWICFVILVNMTIKFRQFQKIHTRLTSCQTTFSAPIGDLIVAFCTHFIFRKSHERTAPNVEQKFFTESKTELGAFYPQAQYEG